MDSKIKTWLYDILKAISEVESYFIDTPKDFFTYQADMKTKRAVERNIEIIGEAMNRILIEDEFLPISNPRKMVGMRNRIIHGYENVSDELIWGVVSKHLPILKREIEQLLHE